MEHHHLTTNQKVRRSKLRKSARKHFHKNLSHLRFCLSMFLVDLSTFIFCLTSSLSIFLVKHPFHVFCLTSFPSSLFNILSTFLVYLPIHVSCFLFHIISMFLVSCLSFLVFCCLSPNSILFRSSFLFIYSFSVFFHCSFKL